MGFPESDANSDEQIHWTPVWWSGRTGVAASCQPRVLQQPLNQRAPMTREHLVTSWFMSIVREFPKIWTNPADTSLMLVVQSNVSASMSSPVRNLPKVPLFAPKTLQWPYNQGHAILLAIASCHKFSRNWAIPMSKPSLVVWCDRWCCILQSGDESSPVAGELRPKQPVGRGGQANAKIEVARLISRQRWPGSQQQVARPAARSSVTLGLHILNCNFVNNKVKSQIETNPQQKIQIRLLMKVH